MNPIQTALIFAGIPLLVTLLIAVAVLGPSAARHSGRYRPGRPWDHEPSWFVPHPAALKDVVPSRPALRAPARSAIDSSPASSTEQPVATPRAVGGASGEW